jgi:RNA polymerase sigma-70 factor, ECF subfamily
MNVVASSGPTPFGFAFGKHDQLFVSELFGGAADASAVSMTTAPASPNRVRWAAVPMTGRQEAEATALMIRAQQGDAAAYSALLTALASTAKQYVRNRCGDVPWVDDVAQETLLTIHSARRTYDPRRPFSPWFYAILSSRMIDVIRRERRVRSREFGTDVLPERISPAGSGDDRAAALDGRQIKSALDALPQRQREIVSAIKLRDESVKDVSERLGMSQSAVKVTAHRGYKTLRRLLGGKDA